jgi:hypothetical protein
VTCCCSCGTAAAPRPRSPFSLSLGSRFHYRTHLCWPTFVWACLLLLAPVRCSYSLLLTPSFVCILSHPGAVADAPQLLPPPLLPRLRSHSPALVHVCLLLFMCSCLLLFTPSCLALAPGRAHLTSACACLGSFVLDQLLFALVCACPASLYQIYG